MENQTFENEFTSDLHRQGDSKRPVVKPLARPLWFSRRIFIALSAVGAVILFLLIFALLYENNEESAFLWASVIAISAWGIAFAGREILVRRAKTQWLLAKEHTNYSAKTLPTTPQKPSWTIEQNAVKIKEIQKLAGFANSPEATPANHLAVTRACQIYLETIEETLPTVRVGSPRLAAFRAGQEKAKKLHHKHSLAWAETESRNLTREAMFRATPDEKISVAQKALATIEKTLQVYPQEKKLHESATFLREYIGSTRVARHVEFAEREVFKKHWKKAIDHYQDALFYLSQEYDNLSERESMTEQLEAKIETLRGKLQKNRKLSKTRLAESEDN